MTIANFNKKNNQNQGWKQQPLYQEPNLLETSFQDDNIEMPDISSEESICNVSNRGRVVVLIDGSNLFYAALQLGIEIDYSKLLCHLAKGGKLLRAFFYTGVDRTNEKQQGFLLWMRRNGYRVVTKDVVQFPDGSKKANLEVELAVDMMTLAPYCDTVVLVSGDGDLAYAVNAVSYKGVRVEVVSLRSMTSESLINVADCFIDIDSIKEEIQKASHSHSQVSYM
ncbi:NYN domain-containing protein [Chlorogloeopsis sp. ULAP01]|uniref:LabA-like NYN domain-containing protein n=1 Tax=Chlorogloeopsis sp. ULAP01 TaxID=3056483 RepID=UPI0025AAFCB4|nr:NYN domain-containing protein [Chlorogloeopsis sp. ULAP01]MDM9385601.1 NYN domain-containing protein [Chlorogloeopsis sp. ULAP01]